MGFPYIAEVQCGGDIFNCYIDTGASISYINDLNHDYGIPFGNYEDFNPIFGDFSTEVRICRLNIAGNSFRAKVSYMFLEKNCMLYDINNVPLQESWDRSTCSEEEEGLLSSR